MEKVTKFVTPFIYHRHQRHDLEWCQCKLHHECPRCGCWSPSCLTSTNMEPRDSKGVRGLDQCVRGISVLLQYLACNPTYAQCCNTTETKTLGLLHMWLVFKYFVDFKLQSKSRVPKFFSDTSAHYCCELSAWKRTSLWNIHSRSSEGNQLTRYMWQMVTKMLCAWAQNCVSGRYYPQCPCC